MLASLLNGVAIADRAHAIALDDRGFNYGDGLFETMCLRAGHVRYLDAHLERLLLGCGRLGIPFTDRKAVEDDVIALAKVADTGIVKVIVTRGAGGRGYRGPKNPAPTRVAMLFPAVDFAKEIRARWCDTRLARHSQLAGIKHLNRLEQVVAQSEWHEPSIEEGLMQDTEDEVVCGTSSNLFVVSENVLSTPDLRFCGVLGVMRGEVLKRAAKLGFKIRECTLWREDVLSASEVFVTNAVRGIRPIVALDAQSWTVGPVTRQLLESMKEDA